MSEFDELLRSPLTPAQREHWKRGHEAMSQGTVPDASASEPAPSTMGLTSYQRSLIAEALDDYGRSLSGQASRAEQSDREGYRGLVSNYRRKSTECWRLARLFRRQP